MNIATAIELFAYGTSEGVTRAWDTRGRGRHLHSGETTEDRYRDKDTKLWSPERSEMHDRVINEMVEGKKPVLDRAPIAYVLGGGTASGKTTMSRAILGEDSNVLRVDPDEIKLKIPEYDQLKKDDPDHAAARVHEESGYLTKSLMAEAIARGLDLTYDSTTSGKGAMPMIRTLINQGYDVHIMFADVPLALAKERADWRARNSPDPVNKGRFVPEDIIHESHQRAAQNFFVLKDMPGISSVRLYDNSTRDPKLIFENGKIYDDKFFGRYKKKAYEDVHASAQRHGLRSFSKFKRRKRA